MQYTLPFCIAIMSLNELMNEISNFVSERDWEQFHTPKNIAMSVAIEAGELLECLQWDSPTTSEIMSDKKKLTDIADEIADVQIYLLRMCSLFDIDPIENSRRKLELNKKKYPVIAARYFLNIIVSVNHALILEFWCFPYYICTYILY